ncbi:MAG: hypothetical protein EHM64_01760 [Ignavibacteriae bacterium]|nr:MAG: hypothetical protein EHM64_01760 [Ignavibacteriota bacterium]
MAVTYRFESGIVFIETFGEFSLTELRRTILESFADPSCPDNCFLLIDLSESQGDFIRTKGEAEAMNPFFGSIRDRFNQRIAFVAPQDLQYGLVRMNSVESEHYGFKVEVFRKFADARKWLLMR